MFSCSIIANKAAGPVVNLANVSGITRQNFSNARVTLTNFGSLQVTTFSSLNSPVTDQWCIDNKGFSNPGQYFKVRFNGGSWQPIANNPYFSMSSAGGIFVEIAKLDSDVVIDSATYTFS